eukprot:TRINITY_DN5355_c0_g1_i8.p1 TRINITY_DN5355_c0_g1~~TRINITY_DN5355_c0_g1_i8.p1  ORF type:complete len:225 (-),score=-5.99 TRINITY_DN5355_c0_g1_i8:153-827(-)
MENLAKINLPTNRFKFIKIKAGILVVKIQVHSEPLCLHTQSLATAQQFHELCHKELKQRTPKKIPKCTFLMQLKIQKVNYLSTQFVIILPQSYKLCLKMENLTQKLSYKIYICSITSLIWDLFHSQNGLLKNSAQMRKFLPQYISLKNYKSTIKIMQSSIVLTAFGLASLQLPHKHFDHEDQQIKIYSRFCQEIFITTYQDDRKQSQTFQRSFNNNCQKNCNNQ